MKSIAALCIATLLLGCNTSKNTTTENTTDGLETPATVIVSATPKMSEIVSTSEVKEIVSFHGFR
ncbi:hypothetical protein N7U66_07965 [Lacinutrix neustonica]|uniref:Uncharacterized protein n=1 Tax=Lacinutrix neustonica TaxID=2980107 RepID=A0A9E8MXE8_9FLAO|nr:hypothetical protein [Lacinutrix neustonica]WAC03433.1 hypothetical protein N7U66_07965 [Lacinutrix neustonica]